MRVTSSRAARLAATAVVAVVAAACVPVTPPPPPPPSGGGGAPPPNIPALHRSVMVNMPGDVIWDLAFANDGNLYFTRRGGQIHVRRPNGTVALLGTVPNVRSTGGEGGLMGIATDPEWSATTNRFLYICFSWKDPVSPATENRVAKWEVDAAATGFVTPEPQVIVPGMPHNDQANGRHSGCRPRFKPGTTELWVGTGDAATNGNPQSDLSLGGKVLRVDRDGNGLPGNLTGRIWSKGHRNVQGIAFSPNNVAYSVEHGPGSDDEVNRLNVPGDRGWHPDGDPQPYNEGVPMTAPGFLPAAWSSGQPTWAPSGATFLIGPQWKDWNGRLAVGMLKTKKLSIMGFGPNATVASIDDRFIGEQRLRSVVQSPQGNLYISTDSGQIWVVTPL